MSAARSAARQVLTVRVGEEFIGLPAGEVGEVIRSRVLTRVPHAPPSLLGVTNLRGAVLPVVSLAGLLGRETAGVSSRTRIVVMVGTAAVGLLVDEVRSLRAVPGERQDGGSTGDQDAERESARVEAGAHVTERFDLGNLLDREFSGLHNRGTAGTPSSGRGPVQTAPQVMSDDVALVVFDVAGQDFALPLAAVREVTTVPVGATVGRPGDDALPGSLPLGDPLLPVASARALLGFPEVGANANGRIVVARCGDALVGLLVDGVRAIHRVPFSAIDAVPAVLRRAKGEAEIDSICRVDGGLRLVSILSPERLFRGRRTARVPSAVTPREPDRKSTDVRPAATRQFVVFHLGEEHYGLPVEAVEEVVRAPDALTRVPRAPAFIEGVMNLRGTVMPVIDQRRRFASGSAGGGGRIVVVRLDDARVGFVVDGVSEVLSASDDQITAMPALGDDRGDVFDQVLHSLKTGQMILLINPRELLDRAERRLLAQMDQANAASGAA